MSESDLVRELCFAVDLMALLTGVAGVLAFGLPLVLHIRERRRIRRILQGGGDE